MRRIIPLILLYVLVLQVKGQYVRFDTKLDFFFDNTEFAKSTYTIDQTMAGVNLAQFIGWEFERSHRLVGGVEVNKFLGTRHVIDDVQVMAYYQYQDDKTSFKAGSFHRDGLLNDYSNFFFQDSINYYRRTMDGLYVKRGTDKTYVKFWLDWTGLQSDVDRERFYIGTSVYHTFMDKFYIDFQSYMFHYAGTNPPKPDKSVCDNLLAKASIGYKYAQNEQAYHISLGVLTGFERTRDFMEDYYMPIGFTVQFNGRYKWFETENSLYIGQKRMRLYDRLGHQFYWGNPFLRGAFYWQNKLFVNVLNTKYVKGQLAFKQHLSEGQIHYEQLFTLKVNLGKMLN